MDADGRQGQTGARAVILMTVAVDLRLKRLLWFKGRASGSRPESIGHSLDVAYRLVLVRDRQGRHWWNLVR